MDEAPTHNKPRIRRDLERMPNRENFGDKQGQASDLCEMQHVS